MVVEHLLRASTSGHATTDTDHGIHIRSHDAGDLNHRGTDATVSAHHKHTISPTDLERTKGLHSSQASKRKGRGFSKGDRTGSRGDPIGTDSHVLRPRSRPPRRFHPQVAPDSRPYPYSPDSIADFMHESSEVHTRPLRKPHSVEQTHLSSSRLKVDGIDAERDNLDNNVLGARTRHRGRSHLKHLRRAVGAELHRPHRVLRVHHSSSCWATLRSVAQHEEDSYGKARVHGSASLNGSQ